MKGACAACGLQSDSHVEVRATDSAKAVEICSVFIYGEDQPKVACLRKALAPQGRWSGNAVSASCVHCGRDRDYYTRGWSVFGLCGECEETLKAAKRLLAKRAPIRAQAYIDQAFGRLDRTDNGRHRDRLRQAIRDAIAVDPGSSEGNLNEFLVPADRLPALQTLVEELSALAEALYQKGHRDGANLLHGLAEGTVSVQTYNDKTTKTR